MGNELRTLAKLRQVNLDFPCTEPIKRWKAAGKKVIGIGCSHIPEEVIYAAGMLPVRVIGNNEESGLDEADAWLHINCCSHERNRFQLLVDHQFGFLDGLVSTSLCDCHRQSAEVAQYLKLVPFTFLLEMPVNDDEDSVPRYVYHLRELIEALQEHFGVQITDEDLRRGIAIVNRKRDLLRQISALRLADAPPISGSEMTELMNAGFCMPADEFGDLLAELLAELTSGERCIGTKFRLMLAGSPVNNAEFLAGIEALGGLIVADETCMGADCWDPGVELTEGRSPLEAVAYRYHREIPCPIRTPFALRLKSAASLARRYRVDGVVLQVIRNCFPYAYYAPCLARHLESCGIPVLQLEKECGTSQTGQISTRIQAFLESLLPSKSLEVRYLVP